MKIPEHLARFAIKQGMWGLVRKIAPSFAQFAAERRARVDPNEIDPLAYGSDGNAENMYAVPRSSTGGVSEVSRGITTYGNKRRLRKLASMVVLASGVVLAMKPSSSSSAKVQAKRRKYARSGLPARV